MIVRAASRPGTREVLSLATLAILAALILAARPQCAAQQTANIPLSSYEGQNVSSVQIQGRPDVSLSDLHALISVQKGQPLAGER